MKIVFFMVKLTIAMIFTIISIASFIVLLVSMGATVLILHGESNIHITWTIPTILVIGLAMGAFVTKIYHALFKWDTSLP